MTITTMTPVSSSQINSIGHHAQSETMRVLFHNGAIYEYSHVDAAQFGSLINAKSVGSAFSKEIKAYPNTFPCTKVVS